MPWGNKKIFVLPVPHESVQGRGSYSFVTSSGNFIPAGRQFARGVQVPFGFVERPEAPGKLATGLDDTVDNPFYEQSVDDLPMEVRPGQIWIDKYSMFSKSPKITKQLLYEIIDNVPEGYYTSNRNYPSMTSLMDNPTVDKDTKPTFLESFRIYLSEGVNVFTADNQRGRLGIMICESHPQIAKNRESINPNFHRFYIGSEEEAVVEKNKKRTEVTKALGKLSRLYDDYPEFYAYQFGIVLGIVKGDISSSSLRLQLDDFIWEQKKTNEGAQEERIGRFNELFGIFDDDKDKLYIKYLIKQALNTGVFANAGGSVLWPAKKTIENLYKLGTNINRIETMFYNELMKYDPGVEADNSFADLENELKNKNVRCK